jgi:hypothetical protein
MHIFTMLGLFVVILFGTITVIIFVYFLIVLCTAVTLPKFL